MENRIKDCPNLQALSIWPISGKKRLWNNDIYSRSSRDDSQMNVSFQKRKAIGRSVIATAVVVILVVVGVWAYYVFAPSPGPTGPTGTVSSGTLSLTFANVPIADPANGSDGASTAAL